MIGVESGVIGRRPVPELGTPDVAAAGEEIADHVLERLAPARVEAQVEAGELGHAADADAVVEAGHRHLVGLVEHGEHRRGVGVDQRHRQRVALDRIHGQIEAEAGGHRPRVAAEGEHVAVGARPPRRPRPAWRRRCARR